MESHDTKRANFLNSYEGKELLKKHNMTEKGTWKIFGADTNCDLGGSHHMPDLGLYRGFLKDIINYAIEIPSFWSWGPGRIEKVHEPVIIDVDENSIREKEELKKRKTILEQELEDLKTKISKL